MRVGLGYDLHPLRPNRPLVIGGIEVEYNRGLDGHSDADVLTHAVIDALLGAAALGDIGQHFPDTDERFRGADSLALARATAALSHQAGYAIVHVDSTIVIERPHIAPVREQIRETLAGALSVAVSQVSVKATRGEGMGFIGRQEGAAALAVATLAGNPDGV